MDNKIKELPLIALRGIVPYPKIVFSFDIIRTKSTEALEYALKDEELIFLSAQMNETEDDISVDTVYNIGAICRIRQVIRIHGNMIRVIVEGEEKASILKETKNNPFIMAEIQEIQEINNLEEVDAQAYINLLNESFQKYSMLSGKISPESIMDIINADEIYSLMYSIAARLPFKLEDKQKVLSLPTLEKKVFHLLKSLEKEIDILNIQKEISQKVKTKVEKTQKEYYLREQIKVIQEELGEGENINSEIDEFKKRLKEVNLSEEAQKKVEKEISRLSKLSSSSAENVLSRDYIDLILSLPWDIKSVENKSIKKAQQILDKDHFGLEKIKERILEYLSVKQKTNSLDAPILCLVGPPGVGKTSIAKSVARALNRKYTRMSLGGVRDEAEIRGHRKTYVGAMPGRIITSIKSAGTSNPLILLDEIDKLANDHRGDPSSALLEVLDAEQNFSFRDNYLELAYDISDVLFICTANDLSNVPSALKDRFEILELSSYTEPEKTNIASKFLIKKQLEKHGLSKTELKIKSNVIPEIIQLYTREAGVRQLERQIARICRKTVKILLTEEISCVTISKEDIQDFLGPRKYKPESNFNKNQIGKVCGLAWTSVGGKTMPIEVNIMKGKGKFNITGNIGKVMDESYKAALSYIRANCDKLNISDDFYENTDIHVHIPEGAVPKDGPSAGITLTTALVSALTDTPIKSQLAMTGEISIRGSVLPIGGLKEKVLAAKRNGIKTIIIPQENECDLLELPQYAKENIDFVLASTINEVLKNALIDYN